MNTYGSRRYTTLFPRGISLGTLSMRIRLFSESTGEYYKDYKDAKDYKKDIIKMICNNGEYIW